MNKLKQKLIDKTSDELKVKYILRQLGKGEMDVKEAIHQINIIAGD